VSIHRRRDGWQVKWRQGSKQRSRSFTRKSDAVRFQAEVVRAKQLGPALARELDKSRMTLAEYVAGPWRNHAVNLSIASQQGYKWALQKHLTPLLDEPIMGLDVPTLAEHQRRMLDGGASPTTIREVMVRLSGICQIAVEHGAIPANPVRGLRKPRRENDEEVVPLTPAEVERLMAGMIGRDKAIVLLGAHLGLRPLEIRQVLWSDLGDGTLTIGRTRTKATARRTRVIEVPQITTKQLKEWSLQSGRPGLNEPIIGPLSPNGLKLWGSKKLRPALAHATEGRITDATVYLLRHSHASALHYCGWTVPSAAKRLGHSGEMHVRTYAHVIESLGAERWTDLDAMIRDARSLMFPNRSPTAAEDHSNAD
jgi:integrase